MNALGPNDHQTNVAHWSGGHLQRTLDCRRCQRLGNLLVKVRAGVCLPCERVNSRVKRCDTAVALEVLDYARPMRCLICHLTQKARYRDADM